jgi:hypothetical protein
MPNRSSPVNSSLSRTGFTKRSGEYGAPSMRLSEKSDFKSWGFKMSNVSNEEKPYVEQIVDLEHATELEAAVGVLKGTNHFLLAQFDDNNALPAKLSPLLL